MNEPPAQGPVDHAARPGAARGRVRPGARVHPGRAAARTGAEDLLPPRPRGDLGRDGDGAGGPRRSEEHTSELQSHSDLVCRLLLEKKKKKQNKYEKIK